MPRPPVGHFLSYLLQETKYKTHFNHSHSKYSRSVQATGKLIFHSEIMPEVKEVMLQKLRRISEQLRLEGSSGGHLIQPSWLNHCHQEQIAQGCPVVKYVTWVAKFRLLFLKAHKSANLPSQEDNSSSSLPVNAKQYRKDELDKTEEWYCTDTPT